MTPAAAKDFIVARLGRLGAHELVTVEALASQAGVSPRLASTIVARLAEADTAGVPWHRVVASGGAIGRHRRRSEQMCRLQQDGFAVSSAGIVEMPIAGATARPPGSRSRGMRDRP